MSQEKKEKFREQFKDWVERTLERRLDTLSQDDASRMMSRFFVSEVLERLMPGIVPDDDSDLQNSLVDGPNDSGVDFIYRSDGHVLMIQSKLRKPEKDESAEALGRFCDAPQRLFQAISGKTHKLSSQLRELASEIDWETDFFHLYYLTTGRLSPSVQARFEQGIVPPDGIPDFEERIDFQLLGETSLNQQWREARSAGDFPKTTVPVRFIADEDGQPWCHFTDSGSRSLYIGQISGAEISQIYSQHRASLFTMNIRDYVGDTSTNKAIIATALADPSDFVFFNNGITAIASNVTEELDQRILRCERLSIINGAQTVRSLRRAATSKKAGEFEKSLQDVRVLMRIVTFSFPQEISFVQDTTRFNNTQNSVKVADFRSNDPVQKDLATRFYQLHLGSKRLAYKNKRSPSKAAEIAINLEEFAKTLHSFNFGPDDMQGGTKYLFDTSSKGGYKKVFGDPEHHLGDDEFKLMSGTYFACEQIKDLWDKERVSSKKKGEALRPALERKWLVYFVVGALLRAIYKRLNADLEADLRRLYKPNSWIDGANKNVSNTFEKYYEVAAGFATQAYDLRAEDVDTFRHRNWFRSEQTLTDITKIIERSLVMFPSLDHLMLFKVESID
jgi:hypothetical protein